MVKHRSINSKSEIPNPKSKSWFEKWFSNKFYLELYQHRDEEDARWMVNLLQRSISVNTKSKVLDIACGSGRHSLELARRGFDVTGFDLSKFLISEAKKAHKNSKEKDLKVRFLIKDMRDFNFKNSFDIAVNIFTSFGYFEDDKENFKVIENVSDSLKTGGYFIFDFLNKGYIEKNIIPYSKTRHGKIIVEQKRKIENGFVRKHITIKKGKEILNFDEVLKLYSVSEFKKAFESYDLKFQNIYGDYFGNKFNINKSQRLIIIAKKS
ncbi:MAG: class I SAM-dependent methyltransferase [Ignavibacteria bacterium]|nr:class I SAM-dependent methyltransferase [Ignavibacteria bacterium]